MKDYYLPFFTIVIFLTVFCNSVIAQSTNGINYQAVIHSDQGAPIRQQLIQVRFSILDGSEAGSTVYQEEHTTNTSMEGTFHVVIGQGNTLSGTFQDVQWAEKGKYLKVEVNTGSGYKTLGTLPFMAVPYALYAEQSGSSFELPYQGEAFNETLPAMDISNTSLSTQSTAILARVGEGSAITPVAASAVIGSAETGHGVAGYSSGPGGAGILGQTEASNGNGVRGTANNGAIGGYFESLGEEPGPALVTGNGNVGIGTDSPQEKLQVNGHVLVNSLVGAIKLGAPNNGDQFHFTTAGGGSDLLLFAKKSGSQTLYQRLLVRENGRIGIGYVSNPAGQLEISSNSEIGTPQLVLTEEEDDYARLSFRNTINTNYFWSIGGLNASQISDDVMRFTHSANGDILTLNSSANVGIYEPNPTARLHLFQNSQNVGTGLRLDDGINEDWDITHGFGLRFHYGGELRGFISATNGAYMQGSDMRLKLNIQPIKTVLDNVNKLKVMEYHYAHQASHSKSTGFIAQDVLPLFPGLVGYSAADDLYGVDYAGFSVIAIKAIQEQQILIEGQQKKIENLEERLKKLEAKINPE
ncbi:MAG TPA: tail fiber domain-containing protein [Saprospiraceae bacterium]|nr:tail fiber domain-containing protein [Saprospiraceae bacterium]